MISFSSDAKYAGLTILLYGEYLDPYEVDAILGISATKSFKKGDRFSKGQHIRRSGMWSLELKREGHFPSDDLEKFVDTVPAHLLPVSNINGVTSGRLSLWVDTKHEGNEFEVSIDKQNIDLINKLGVQFYLTVFKEIEDE